MLAMSLTDAVHVAALLVEPPSLEVVIVVSRHVYALFFSSIDSLLCLDALVDMLGI